MNTKNTQGGRDVNNLSQDNIGLAKFLVIESAEHKCTGSYTLSSKDNNNKTSQDVNPTTSKSDSTPKTFTPYFELDRVYLADNVNHNKLDQYYLIPYNVMELTFFIFISINVNFPLSVLDQIDQHLALKSSKILEEINETISKRNLTK
jgi:hypothetical protein